MHLWRPRGCQWGIQQLTGALISANYFSNWAALIPRGTLSLRGEAGEAVGAPTLVWTSPTSPTLGQCWAMGGCGQLRTTFCTALRALAELPRSSSHAGGHRKVSKSQDVQYCLRRCSKTGWGAVKLSPVLQEEVNNHSVKHKGTQERAECVCVSARAQRQKGQRSNTNPTLKIKAKSFSQGGSLSSALLWGEKRERCSGQPVCAAWQRCSHASRPTRPFAATFS